MRVPKGIMKIAKLCNTDEKSREDTRCVHLLRLKGDAVRAEVCDGFSAIRVDFDEPGSEVLPGFGVAEKTVDGFVTMVPADAALEADRAIGKEVQYLVVDEEPPDGTVRVLVPQAVNQMWEGHDVSSQVKFPPLDNVFPDYQLVEVQAADALKIPAVRITVNPVLLNNALKAMVEASECEGVTIDIPLVRNRVIRLTPYLPAQSVKMTAVLVARLDETRTRKVRLDDAPESAKEAETIPALLPAGTSGDAAAGSGGTRESEFERATLAQIGVEPAVAAKLEADGINTGAQLRDWMQAPNPRKVQGVGKGVRAKLAEVMAQFYEREQPRSVVESILNGVMDAAESVAAGRDGDVPADIAKTIRGMAPREGSGITAVTLSSGGKSVTLTSKDRKRGAKAKA